MSDNKSYRLKTNIQEDEVLKVNLNQDFNILEVLSLKIGTENLYKFHTSNYGCVAGRVLANGGFGIPNAKISIFIEAKNEDLEDDILSYLYPYKSTSSKNKDGIRYNLLPDEQLSECHRNVGTFPSKRMVLDDDNVLEIYDNYYKFTTRSNNSGDYMIFGVPVGEQTLHVDIDLSDIGILSQSPKDLIYKGYNITQFENANMFKKSTSLDNLTQIISQNQNIYVYPFWGEESESDIAISRKDIDIQYEFTPTCVFMGSVITDERTNGISKRCIPSERMGKMDKLTTGKGTIEMIRKKPDGTVEECVIQGNQLIDGNGVWCYQIPMNLDYVRTDEYGNTVPTDDITKGIPTRTSVRFRLSLTEFESEYEYSHLSKVLVPNNPDGVDKYDYGFGTKTTDESFKDLFWNNVYSVKSYIPRIQMLRLNRTKRFSGFKGVNINSNNNPIPYNNMRVDLTFMFSLQCAIFKILLWIVTRVNQVMVFVLGILDKLKHKNLKQSCLYIGDGYCKEMEGWYFAPGCKPDYRLMRNIVEPLDKNNEDEYSIDKKNEDEITKKCVTNNITYFVHCVELTLAMEYDVIQFDFYNDWINGLIYMPRWFADVRQKKTYLGGAIKITPRINACMENAYNGLFARKYVQQCALEYKQDENKNYTKIISENGCAKNGKQRCHKSDGRRSVDLFKNTKPGGGMVHSEQTSKKEHVYYFRPNEWLKRGKNNYIKCNLFATDIILLGSLEENNTQGIPQTFKNLTSTTYQLPEPLASTNLGKEGNLYYSKFTEKKNDMYIYCTGTGTNGAYTFENELTPFEPSFDSVRKWAETTTTEALPEGENNDFDERETPITETSGIDWGYYGPEQKMEGEEINNLKTLYFPGGHFLGISCGESEVNIKSCINLSRICEVGSLISQRQTIFVRSGDTIVNKYLAPTGLISKYEINDYGVKNEFATLNYNGLKTKRNIENNLLEYDFETIYPINFNGELETKIDKNLYNTNRGELVDDSLYRMTIEENSNDYYNFRFNLHKKEGKNNIEDTEKESKFLKLSKYDDGNSVSLPMYENSFYFYFGLKQGNTALDVFYKDFFAECPVLKEYLPSAEVKSENTSFCGNIGKIIIKISNIEQAQYKIDKINDSYQRIYDTTVEITGLTNGIYNVHVKGNNFDEKIETVEIVRNVDEAISAFGFQAYNYKQYVENGEITEFNGYIEFPKNIFDDELLVGVVVYCGFGEDLPVSGYTYLLNNERTDADKNAFVKKVESELSVYGASKIENVADEKNFRVTAWYGDMKYFVRAYYKCKEGEFTEFTKKNIGSVYIQNGGAWDILFGGSNYKSSYNYVIKPLLDSGKFNNSEVNEKWYIGLLDKTHDYYKYLANLYNERDIQIIIADVKRTIFYTNPISEFKKLKGKLLIDGVNRKETTNNIFTLKISGNEELYDKDTNTLTFGNEVDDLSADFLYPTEDVYCSLYDYKTNGKKTNFSINLEGDDWRYPETSFKLPAIYRPFFFNSVFYSFYNPNATAQTETCYVSIANGITSERIVNNTETYLLSFGISTNGGVSYDNILSLERREGDYRELDGSIIGDNDKNKFPIEDFYPTVTGETNLIAVNHYSLYASSKMVAPTNGVITEEIYNSLNFLGYGDFSIDIFDNVKYYRIPKDDINRFVPILGNVYPWKTYIDKIGYVYYRMCYGSTRWDVTHGGSGEKDVVWNETLYLYIHNLLKDNMIKFYDKTTIINVEMVEDDDIIIGINSWNPEFYEKEYKVVNDKSDGIWVTSDNVYPRHTNTVSFIRWYKGVDFKNLVKNLYENVK